MFFLTVNSWLYKSFMILYTIKTIMFLIGNEPPGPSYTGHILTFISFLFFSRKSLIYDGLAHLSHYGLVQPFLQEIRSRLMSQKISFKKQMFQRVKATIHQKSPAWCTKAQIKSFTILLQGYYKALE